VLVSYYYNSLFGALNTNIIKRGCFKSLFTHLPKGGNPPLLPPNGGFEEFAGL